MIIVKDGKMGKEMQLKGGAFELKAEAALAFVRAVIATNEEDDKQMEADFAAMLLSTIDMAKEEGIPFDEERFIKVLRRHDNIGNAFEGLQKIFGKMGGNPNG